MPRGHDELLFCELPDGTRGALPSWMTDAAACAVLTVGKPVVAIAALQELRLLLDAVARGSDPTDASMPSKEAAMRRRNPSIPTQIPLFPPAGPELRIELAAPQQQELIRALAELLLHAAADASVTAKGAARDDR